MRQPTVFCPFGLMLPPVPALEVISKVFEENSFVAQLLPAQVIFPPPAFSSKATVERSVESSTAEP